MTNTAPVIETNATAAVKTARSARSTPNTRPAISKEAGHPAKPNGRKRTARRSDAAPQTSKTNQVLKLLRRAKGGSVAEIATATGWQTHSVRGFLSGTVKKKMGLNVVSEKGPKGMRRYRIAEDGAA